jgi:hypothetical protein
MDRQTVNVEPLLKSAAVHQIDNCRFGGILLRCSPVHQIDNFHFGGINRLSHEVHQNGICRHDPVLWA